MILQETCTTFLEREYALLSETLIEPYENEGFGARSAPFFSVLGARFCRNPGKPKEMTFFGARSAPFFQVKTLAWSETIVKP